MLQSDELLRQLLTSWIHGFQAHDDAGVCRVGIGSINQRQPPFECCDVEALEPINPQYKGGELICGDRFDCIWLMCHFVQNRTFQRPMCRSGKRSFRFDLSVIPEALVNAIRRHRGAAEMDAE